MQLTPIKHSLQDRRNQYMSHIRTHERDKIKNRTRREMMEHYARIDLKQLIEETSGNQLGAEAVQRLLQYANEGNLKAVGHLGNLVIEGRVDAAFFEGAKLKPGYESTWLWFVQVLVDHEYFSLQLLNHCVRSLSQEMSSQTIAHAISCLYKIGKNSQFTATAEETVLLAISTTAARPDKTGLLANAFLSEMAATCKPQPLKCFLDESVRGRLIASLQSGLMRTESKGRRAALKTIHNFSQRRLSLRQLDGRIMEMMREEKSDELADILIDYLIGVASRGDSERMVDLMDRGLLEEMGRWKAVFLETGDDDLLEMLVDLGCEIRACTMNHRLCMGVHRQLHRFGLLDKEVEVELL